MNAGTSLIGIDRSHKPPDSRDAAAEFIGLAGRCAKVTFLWVDRLAGVDLCAYRVRIAVKLPEEFLAELERGMCAAPAANKFRSMLVGGWDLARGFDWCTPYPEHQGHWHHVETTEPPVRIGCGWVFFNPGKSPGVWHPKRPVSDYLEIVKDVEISFADVRECDVPVAAYLETFYSYRASLNET
jgi:hypothetical protein